MLLNKFINTKIVCIKGGLGNQLFCYCRYRQLKEKYDGTVYLFYDYRRMKEHGGIKLQQCFDIQLPHCPFYIFIFVLLIKLLQIIHLFPSLYDINSNDSILIDDFSQEKKYITKASEWLSFRHQDYGKEWLNYAESIKQSSYSVAIHVRRGDYLHPSNIDNFGVCNTEYYKKAISIINNIHNDASYFIFSDDMEWTISNLNFINKATYITFENHIPDHAELQLMTLCNAHIIANSTFSFWGAYLHNIEEAINIYPKRWYKAQEWDNPNIFPDNWIAI